MIMIYIKLIICVRGGNRDYTRAAGGGHACREQNNFKKQAFCRMSFALHKSGSAHRACSVTKCPRR